MPRIFWDTNRMSDGTQRLFHCAWAEVTESHAWICEEVGQEWLHLDLNQGIQVAEMTEKLRSETVAGYAESMQGRIADWWLRHACGPQSILQFQPMTVEQRDLKSRLLEGMEPEHFKEDVGTKLTEHSDARLIAEVLARRSSLVLTRNLKSIQHGKLNTWVQEQGPQYGVYQNGVVYDADIITVHTGLDRQGEEVMLRTAMGALWDKMDAKFERFVSEIREYCTLLGEADLPLTATLLDETIEALKNGPRLEGVLQETSQALPGRTRDAEEHHPKFGGWGIQTPSAGRRKAWTMNRYRYEGRILKEIAERWKENGITMRLGDYATPTHDAEGEERRGFHRAQRRLEKREAQTNLVRGLNQGQLPERAQHILRLEVEQEAMQATHRGIPKRMARDLPSGRNRIKEVEEILESQMPVPEWMQRLEAARAKNTRHFQPIMTCGANGVSASYIGDDEKMQSVGYVGGVKYWCHGMAQAGWLHPEDVPFIERTLEKDLAAHQEYQRKQQLGLVPGR